MRALQAVSSSFAGHTLPQRCSPRPPRFLPALAHAAKTYAASAHWLILVDDDSHVRPEPLLTALHLKDPDEAMYLGDIVPRPHIQRLRSWPAFACGGSGSIFSRAAVQRIDLGRCAAALREAASSRTGPSGNAQPTLVYQHRSTSAVALATVGFGLGCNRRSNAAAYGSVLSLRNPT